MYDKNFDDIIKKSDFYEKQTKITVHKSSSR